MSKESINAIISENLFFKHFTPGEIDLLVKHSAFVSFNEGEYLLTARQEAKGFYFIIGGSVSIQVFSHEHGILEIETIQDGEFLGWSWLVSPYVYHYDAVAFEKTKAIYFDAVALKREMDHNHEFGYKIYKLFTPVIVERLQASRLSILELYEKNF
jgi:CRP/FNR family cyclic AMP-dependent transcriptional regulator